MMPVEPLRRFAAGQIPASRSMFKKLRLRLHKNIFLNYNRYLRELIDHHLARRCPDEEFRKTGDRYFQIMKTHYQKAFDLSRRLEGVPDENLQQAWENVEQHYQRNRFQNLAADETAVETEQPGEVAGKISIEVANEVNQWPEQRIQAFIDQAAQECSGPDGELNGQAMFLKLLEGYLLDEFLNLARELGGKPVTPNDLYETQLRALKACHQANSFCFDEGKFEHFQTVVEQNLNPDRFYEENIEKYQEVEKSLAD